MLLTIKPTTDVVMMGIHIMEMADVFDVPEYSRPVAGIMSSTKALDIIIQAISAPCMLVSLTVQPECKVHPQTVPNSSCTER
jgi:hypothetical protein